MTINIRYAKLIDADAFASIYSNSYKTAFKGIIPESFSEEVFSVDKRKAGFIKELDNNINFNAIMYNDDEPVGILTYGKSKEEDTYISVIEILRIYLEPSQWRKNLGEKLMNWAIEEIANKGYKKIILWVIDDNLRARNFYEKLGFKYDNISRIINVGKEIKDLRYSLAI